MLLVKIPKRFVMATVIKHEGKQQCVWKIVILPTFRKQVW